MKDNEKKVNKAEETGTKLTDEQLENVNGGRHQVIDPDDPDAPEN